MLLHFKYPKEQTRLLQQGDSFFVEAVEAFNVRLRGRRREMQYDTK